MKKKNNGETIRLRPSRREWHFWREIKADENSETAAKFRKLTPEASAMETGMEEDDSASELLRDRFRLSTISIAEAEG